MLSFRAENEARTRDPNLGKVVLYQLSYFRISILEVKEMRLELTRPNGHYPLKVARLPIPPLLHFHFFRAAPSAQNRTRTCTSLNTRTWNERVYHSATWAFSKHFGSRVDFLERKTRLELATPTLARLCSTNWAISAFFLKFSIQSSLKRLCSTNWVFRFFVSFKPLNIELTLNVRELCSFNGCKGTILFDICKTFSTFFWKK